MFVQQQKRRRDQRLTGSRLPSKKDSTNGSKGRLESEVWNSEAVLGLFPDQRSPLCRFRILAKTGKVRQKSTRAVTFLGCHICPVTAVCSFLLLLRALSATQQPTDIARNSLLRGVNFAMARGRTFDIHCRWQSFDGNRLHYARSAFGLLPCLKIVAVCRLETV